MHSRGSGLACHRREHIEHRWLSGAAFRFDPGVPIFDVAAELGPFVEKDEYWFEVRFCRLAGNDLLVSELHEIAGAVDQRHLLLDGCSDDLYVGPVLESQEFDVLAVEDPDRPSTSREVDQQIVCGHGLSASGWA